MTQTKQYNALRAAALQPDAQAKLAEYLETYNQRPEVIEGRARMAAEDRARDEALVRRAVEVSRG
jgi:hypothetical protein